MADVQKPVEVKEVAPVSTDAPAPADTTPADAKPADAEPVAPAADAAAPAAEAAATPADKPKEEATPVEEGHLEHKGAGLNFPKNLMYGKQFFWFGSDALDTKSLSSYLKHEKQPATGHQNASWASHTGKGLLFYGDKSSPHGVINLSDASEPSHDGANKFHFTSKGHKHTFKTSSAAERDNWVAQIKLKIAEAKELAKTVPETEAYKSTLESFKAKLPAKKEEKPVEAAKEEAPVEAPKQEEAAKEGEEAKEEPKEDSKRRSASRKRLSVMGILNRKSTKEEKPAAETPATEATSTEPAAETAPAAESAAPVEPAAEPVPAAQPVATEDKVSEAKDVSKDKPATSKRNSIFGYLQKREKKAETEAAPATPAKDGETSVPATTEAAPVIPPVEATTPLAVETASPATVPTETKDVTPATNGENQKEVKSERRKSSLPSFLAKKEKSVTSEEGDKTEKPDLRYRFSKIRDTIRGRKPAAEKSEEKPASKSEEKPAEATAEVAPAAKAEEEPVNKPEHVAASTPAVTAAA